jgi:hypothetical protein
MSWGLMPVAPAVITHSHNSAESHPWRGEGKAKLRALNGMAQSGNSLLTKAPCLPGLNWR